MNMNPYGQNPYIQQGQMQDLGGIAPMYQNIGGQQANQNAALAQQNQLMNQAAQLGQQSGGGGMNPMALAMALRSGKTPTQADINAKDAQMGGLSTYNPMTQYDISQQYGTDMYSPQSRMLAAQER
jgi:hypothetical protein